jgi:hypothetical protein
VKLTSGEFHFARAMQCLLSLRPDIGPIYVTKCPGFDATGESDTGNGPLWCHGYEDVADDVVPVGELILNRLLCDIPDWHAHLFDHHHHWATLKVDAARTVNDIGYLRSIFRSGLMRSRTAGT